MNRGLTRLWLWLLVGFHVGSLVPQAYTQSIPQSQTFLPSDLAIYQCAANTRHVWEKLSESRAYSRAKELKLVELLQELWSREMEKISGSEASELFQAQWDNPFLRDVAAVLTDMLSHELFIAGDEACTRLTQIYRRWDMMKTLWTWFSETFAGQNSSSPEEAQALAEEGLLLLTREFFAQEQNRLVVPRLLLGWRVSDLNRARAVLEMSRALLTAILLTVPELSQGMRTEEIEGHNFLVVTVPGEIIPWEGIFSFLSEADHEEVRPLEDEIDFSEESADNLVVSELVQILVDQARTLKVELALGIREDWILLGLGPDLKFLHIPPEDNRLANREEFRELYRRVTGEIVYTGYLSASFVKGGNSSSEDFRAVLDVLDRVIHQQPAIFGAFEQWLQNLTARVGRIEPTFGAFAQAAFITPRGMEEVALWWQKAAIQMNTALPGLRLVGPDPITVLAFSVLPEESLEAVYESCRPIMEIGWSGFEQALSLSEWFEDPRRQNFRNHLWMIGRDADRLVREYIIPAVGNVSFTAVLEARSTIEHLPEGMQAPEKPLPFPEVAVIISIADKNRLIEGFKQLGTLVDRLRELIEDEFTNEELSFEEFEPLTALWEIIHSFECKSEPWGTICQLAGEPAETISPLEPVMILTDKMAILGSSREQALRIVEGSPLRPIGLIQDLEKPRLAAAVLSAPKLWEALKPWLEHVCRASRPHDFPGGEETELVLAALYEDLPTIEAISRCIRSITVDTLQELEQLCVRHILVEMSDLPE